MLPLFYSPKTMANNPLKKITAPKATTTVDIGGVPVTIEQASVKHLHGFYTIVEAIAPALAALDANDPLSYERFYRKHSNELIELVAMCANLSVDEVGGWTVEQLEAAMVGLFDVNRDSFLRAAQMANNAASQ